MSDEEECAPPPLRRTVTDGGIPVCLELKVLEQATKNFDGLPPALNRVWFGRTVFEAGGDVWTLEKFMNFGAEGQTYLASRASNGRKNAAKFCSDKDSLEVQLLQKMPRKLNEHPNFLTYELVVVDVASHLQFAKHIIIMDYIPNGEVFEFIASEEPACAGKPVSEGTCRRFLCDLISGMAECYRFGITHRDIKPENLMLNEHGRIIIIDMGHAKRATAQPPERGDDADDDGGLPPPPRGGALSLVRATTVNRYGTESFNAPEVASRKKYDCEQSDVWSIGVIAFLLHAKLPPFRQGGGVAGWEDATGPANEPFWRKTMASGWYAQFPDGMRAFIDTLWRKDPAERPSFATLESVVKADPVALAAYPGLAWLTEPPNDIDAFMAELRSTLPNNTFNPHPDEAPSMVKRW